VQRYSEDYDFRLKQMAGEEKRLLCDELIQKLLQTDSMVCFAALLGEGLQRGEVTFQIANFNSQGCLELHAALMDKEQAVVERALKLKVFYTGEDAEQKAVWNGGNMYRTSTKPLQELLSSLGEDAVWTQIQQLYTDKVSHVYRDNQCNGCNRHGHSNELASYFAFGHDHLLSFIGAVTDEAWSEYQKEHSTCCGVAEVIRNKDGLQRQIDRLAAKRLKRTECLNNQDKLNAAIEEKKQRRAMSRMQIGKGKGKGQSKAAGKVRAMGKRPHESSEDDESMSGSE